jgi:hypothetical protein
VEPGELPKGERLDYMLVPPAQARFPRTIPQQAGRGIRYYDPAQALVDSLLQPAVPVWGGPDFVQQEDAGMVGIESDRLDLSHLARRDGSCQAVVRKVEVRQVLRRPARLQKIVYNLKEENGLSDLPRADQHHGPALVRLPHPCKDLQLQVSPDGVSSCSAHCRVMPPGVLVLEKLTQNHGMSLPDHSTRNPLHEYFDETNN